MSKKGCVLDLRLDDEQGTSAHDYSRYGNDGAIIGCKWVENGLEFNGSSDYVNCGGDASLKLNDGSQGTVSLWAISNIAWADQTNNSSLIQKGNDVGWSCGSYAITDWTTSLYFKLQHVAGGGGADQCHITVPYPTANEWHYFLMAWNGATLYGYVDGVEIDNVPQTVNADFQATEHLWIGKSLSGVFDGSIADAIIYNRAISAAEIYDYYESTKHRYK